MVPFRILFKPVLYLSHFFKQHRAAVTTHLGRAAGNAHRVLESLYQRPIVSVAQVQELTGTTYTAANSLVSRLVKLNILQEATGYKRNRVFDYAPYIAIFGDNPPAPSDEKGRMVVGQHK